jgi:hypothetical protein
MDSAASSLFVEAGGIACLSSDDDGNPQKTAWPISQCLQPQSTNSRTRFLIDMPVNFSSDQNTRNDATPPG